MPWKLGVKLSSFVCILGWFTSDSVDMATTWELADHEYDYQDHTKKIVILNCHGSWDSTVLDKYEKRKKGRVCFEMVVREFWSLLIQESKQGVVENRAKTLTIDSMKWQNCPILIIKLLQCLF